MKLLLLAVVLGLAGAAPLEEDKVCQPHSRPWHVHLHSAGGSSCSGALVNEWWIITSFSCAHGISFGYTASLGDHDISVEEGTEQHIPVAGSFVHRPYRSALHSLGLVRLAWPARFNQYVKPIPLPSSCTQVGDRCSVSGWGPTIPNKNGPSNQLRCIDVPVVDSQTCMNGLPDNVYWSGGMVCAGRPDTDNCLNEEAAVLVCNDQLQGVQWFAVGCQNPSAPSVYTKLCIYNSWINDIMANNSPTQAPPVQKE